MKKLFSILLGMACCLLLIPSANAETINTLLPTSNLYLGTFGTGSNTPTLGQTFTVGPTDTRLDLFAFELGNAWIPFNFNVYVQAWDNTNFHPVGNILWTSPTTVAQSSGGVYTFSNIGLNLNPNTKYVAYWSSLGDAYDDNKEAPQPYRGLDVYSGGGLFLAPIYSPYSFTTLEELMKRSWRINCTNNGTWDGEFRIELSAPPPQVPEASTLFLLGSSSIALIGMRRRIKK